MPKMAGIAGERDAPAPVGSVMQALGTVRLAFACASDAGRIGHGGPNRGIRT